MNLTSFLSGRVCWNKRPQCWEKHAVFGKHFLRSGCLFSVQTDCGTRNVIDSTLALGQCHCWSSGMTLVCLCGMMMSVFRLSVFLLASTLNYFLKCKQKGPMHTIIFVWDDFKSLQCDQNTVFLIILNFYFISILSKSLSFPWGNLCFLAVYLIPG